MWICRRPRGCGAERVRGRVSARCTLASRRRDFEFLVQFSDVPVMWGTCHVGGVRASAVPAGLGVLQFVRGGGMCMAGLCGVAQAICFLFSRGVRSLGERVLSALEWLMVASSLQGR